MIDSSINGMFKIITIEDNNLNIIKYENKLTLILPNYNYVKNRLMNIYQNEITSNNKNLRLLSFVSIKYCADPSTILDNSIEINDTRYFNSTIQSITSIKKIDDVINEIISEFNNKIENNKSSNQFTGIIKIDVKISKSKNIIGGNFIELPEKMK